MADHIATDVVDERGEEFINDPLNILKAIRFSATGVYEIDNYTKDSLTIIYDPKNFDKSFEDFSTGLKGFLDNLFTKRSASNVAYFKSYIWVKYKIDYKYDWDWKANIWIWFVEKRSKAKHIKEKIISFVEDQKKTE